MGEEWVVIAFVTGPHGVRGEVKVAPESDVPGRLKSLKRVTLFSPTGRYTEVTVTGCRPQVGKGVELMSFAECVGRDAAEALKGSALVVKRGESPALPEGRYYDWQLMGLKVVTTDGRDLGEIEEVLRTGANDVYVTGEALLPAIPDVVREIDLDAGRMVIEPIPGLLE